MSSLNSMSSGSEKSEENAPSKAPDAQKRLSMIVYEGKAPPRYFEINKNLLRFVLIALPILTVISLGITFGGSLYFKQIREIAKRKEPKIIEDLRQEIAGLENTNRELNDLNTELQDKLATGFELDEKMTTLALFRPIPGMKNLTASPLLKIEKIRIQSRDDKLVLNFRIVNQTPGGKLLTGFFFILMKSQDGLYIYPEKTFREKSFQIPFTRGESFATQRFRPVESITFPKPKDMNDFLFKVVVFSRSGDLLIKKILTFDEEEI